MSGAFLCPRAPISRSADLRNPTRNPMAGGGEGGRTGRGGSGRGARAGGCWGIFVSPGANVQERRLAQPNMQPNTSSALPWVATPITTIISIILSRSSSSLDLASFSITVVIRSGAGLRKACKATRSPRPYSSYLAHCTVGQTTLYGWKRHPSASGPRPHELLRVPRVGWRRVGGPVQGAARQVPRDHPSEWRPHYEVIGGAAARTAEKADHCRRSCVERVHKQCPVVAEHGYLVLACIASL